MEQKLSLVKKYDWYSDVYCTCLRVTRTSSQTLFKIPMKYLRLMHVYILFFRHICLFKDIFHNLKCTFDMKCSSDIYKHFIPSKYFGNVIWFDFERLQNNDCTAIIFGTSLSMNSGSLMKIYYVSTLY